MTDVVDVDDAAEDSDGDFPHLATELLATLTSGEALELTGDEEGWGALVTDEVFYGDAEDAHGPFNFDPAWDIDGAALVQALEEIGLVGERLAEQRGEVPQLVDQLCTHLNLNITSGQKEFHIAQIRDMVEDEIELTPRRKRFRYDHISAYMARLDDFAISDKAKVKKSDWTLEPWPDTDRRLPPKGQRRYKLSQSVRPGLSREDFDEEAKRTGSLKVIRILERGEAPIVQLAATSANVSATLRGAIGATRPGTLTAYVASFGAFQEYLYLAQGIAWPRTVVDVLDYLHMRSTEPCAVSVPQVFLQSLGWFERTAAIPSGERLSCMEVVRQTVAYIVELVSVGGPPLKQAPRPSVSLLASLELFVVNPNYPPGLRIKAFSILAKSYCTLREDDIQHLPPDRLRTMGRLIVAELMRTKTTGRTKRVKELPLALWTGTSVVAVPWISVGMQLLGKFGEPARDHLLPRMSRDGLSSGYGPLTYAASAGMTKILLQHLKRPVLLEGKWIEGTHSLVHPLMADFWTEHSPRAFMPSLLAQLEVDQTKADFLGKWCPSGAIEYTRTFRTVVGSLQKMMVGAVRDSDGRLAEDDIVDRVDRFAKQKSFTVEVADSMKRHLQTEENIFRKALESEEGKVWAGEANMESFQTQAQLQAASKPPEVIRKIGQPARLGKFLIIYSRNKTFARLHRITDSNCPWVRVQVQDCLELDAVNTTMYNSRCKLCWPERPEADASESSVSEDTSEFVRSV